MNEAQIKLARHALGFDENVKKSYRNRFYTYAENKADFAAWKDLEQRKLAERTMVPTKDRRKYYMFSLTLAGAKMVLRDGESLDEEDFPQ